MSHSLPLARRLLRPRLTTTTTTTTPCRLHLRPPPPSPFSTTPARRRLGPRSPEPPLQEPPPPHDDGPPAPVATEPRRRRMPLAAAVILLLLASTTAPKTDALDAPPRADQVATGTSTVPFFPRTIHLPTTATATATATSEARSPGTGAGTASTSYQLLGLGIRTVSFLSVQVYVVGLYVASAELATLQARLVRGATDAEPASAPVAAEEEEEEEREREALRARLLGGDGAGEQAWEAALLGAPAVASVLRVVPVRSTDFAHLRDGWVRGMQARSGAAGGFEDGGFGDSVALFRALFSGAGRKALGRGEVMLLERDGAGRLRVWVRGGKEAEEGLVVLGEVADERVSRLLWLGYLAGGKVASEGARRSIVEGVMELVERPMGTVETRVL